jgi:hypothetical protein
LGDRKADFSGNMFSNEKPKGQAASKTMPINCAAYPILKAIDSFP